MTPPEFNVREVLFSGDANKKTFCYVYSAKKTITLLRHPGWEAQSVNAYLWERADQAVEQRLNPQDEVYVIWDESVIKKAESLKPERLCAVRSSKAHRLLLGENQKAVIQHRGCMTAMIARII